MRLLRLRALVMQPHEPLTVKHAPRPHAGGGGGLLLSALGGGSGTASLQGTHSPVIRACSGSGSSRSIGCSTN